MEQVAERQKFTLEDIWYSVRVSRLDYSLTNRSSVFNVGFDLQVGDDRIMFCREQNLPEVVEWVEKAGVKLLHAPPPKPNPNSQAVQLLRRFVEESPWQEDEFSYPNCRYCHADERDGHKPDCVFVDAESFLTALDVK